MQETFGHDGVALEGLPINATKGGPRERANHEKNGRSGSGGGH